MTNSVPEWHGESAPACYAVLVPSLYHLDPGPECPELVRAIIEIPKNSANKYEYDGKLELFRLDRSLYSPMHYPGDYGFIPGTLAEDGDPMDVLVLVQEPSFTGCMIEVRPVGILNMVDDQEGDQKVLAVPNRNPRYNQIHTMDQIFPHVRREIEHFFGIYKELEGRVTTMQGWGGPREARKAIVESRNRYLELQAAGRNADIPSDSPS
ncbi:MAG: inorganic diphosphatase [Bryobacterales bacterium]|nr:inorganic diphosphatase [Bryobacterales bacterium]MEB2360933.1 inorganic diphosphatase [Bryobacterales bacterium]